MLNFRGDELGTRFLTNQLVSPQYVVGQDHACMKKIKDGGRVILC